MNFTRNEDMLILEALRERERILAYNNPKGLRELTEIKVLIQKIEKEYVEELK